MRGLLNAKYVQLFDNLPLVNFRNTVDELKSFIPKHIYQTLLEIIEIKSEGLEKDTISNYFSNISRCIFWGVKKKV